MTPDAMLRTIERWRDAGWLRDLDLALARFVAETDAAAPASLLLAAALVASMEGRGHSALPLVGLAADPLGTLLSMPADAELELRRALLGCWPADDAVLRDAWQGLRCVEIEPAGVSGASPLVVSGGMLYLRRYWRYETGIAAQIGRRARSLVEPVDLQLARKTLAGLFDARAAGEAGPDWQQVACALALRGRLTIVTGGPGTGKTYTAARILALLQALHTGDAPLRVALAAPTGKAAARLRHSIGRALHELAADPRTAPLVPDRWAATLGPARTLHALLGTQPGTRSFRHDAANPLDVDLLIVDEASMVHLEMMSRLLCALPDAARVVLLGDKDQLASVEAGAVLGDLCEGAGEGGVAGGYRPETAAWIEDLTGCAPPAADLGDGPALAQQTVVLRSSHRFDAPIARLAQAVNRGDADAALARLGDEGEVALASVGAREAGTIERLALDGRAGAPGGYRSYLETLAQRPAGTDAASFDAWVAHVLRSFDTFRVLCALREGAWGVAGLNAAIEAALSQAGLLAAGGEWYEGRPVMVTRNDPVLGVFNGDVGIVLRGPLSDPALRCWFAGVDGLRSVSVARLAEVETAFAMTVHKSQGSEFGHVALVLPDADAAVLTRELVYTGITRARDAFTLVASRPELFAAAAGRVTQRVSGLRERLR